MLLLTEQEDGEVLGRVEDGGETSDEVTPKLVVWFDFGRTPEEREKWDLDVEDGRWGIQSVGFRLKPFEKVVVRRKDGRELKVQVGRVVWRGITDWEGQRVESSIATIHRKYARGQREILLLRCQRCGKPLVREPAWTYDMGLCKWCFLDEYDQAMQKASRGGTRPVSPQEHARIVADIQQRAMAGRKYV